MSAEEDRARLLKQKRDAEAKRRARLKRQEVATARNRDRVKAWAEANPDRVKARRDAWLAANQDRQREHARNYYHRHKAERQQAAREQNARRRTDPAYRAAEQEYRNGRREVLNEQQNRRRSTPEGRAAHNAEQNARRRIDRRLHKLGLPPRPKHRWTIDERLEMERELASADRRRWTKADIAALQEELRGIRGETWWHTEERWRAALERRIEADLAYPAKLANAVEKFLATREGRQLHEDVRLDAIARILRGARPYPSLDAEARRRAQEVVLDRARQVPRIAPVQRKEPPGAGRQIA
ncbi:MAG: hypothetical protein AB7K08_10360 [Microbacteriaceae bacterium]